MCGLIQWSLDHKALVLGSLAFCFFVSTVALATKNSRCYEKSSDGTGAHWSEPKFTIAAVFDKSRKFYRLPRNVLPEHYNLTLEPNIYEKTFKGTVIITVKVLQPTKEIILHSKNLSIDTMELRKHKKRITLKAYINTVDEREFLMVYLVNEVKAGTYNLTIEFSGRLDQGLIGFYSSTLKNGGVMVASKFQPTYARQAFPCFDEPDFKATYDITLVKPRSHIALSNMNEVSITPDEDINMERVTFATSVPMSTYLAVFVICDFDSKSDTINANGIGHNFKLRSFAQRNETHKIDFAQDIGKRATEFYIKYYEVPFPLPKLDMIAIPDYVSGATEHWGLITYRETSFLIDEATASVYNKINVANTIAHELAHMWFGNLVTMKWWDEVWLNEGFASYMQVKSLNAIEPSWTMLEKFLPKTLHPVLVTDAKLSSHPIVQIVDTPDQITSIFDAISYNKGSSILRMLEGFIGEENFRKGVSDYLKQYRFDNTVTQQLLDSLEPYFKVDNPDLDLTYIMDTWTRQMGYPVLSVKRAAEPHTYEITQSRFLLDPDAVSPDDSPYDYRWFVPVTYKTNRGASKNILWFSDTANSVKLTVTKDDFWLKINNNQVGYYRVNYAPDIWRELILQLKSRFGELTISDRAHLLNDAFALAEAKLFPYDTALNISGYLRAEPDYVPWETARGIFVNLAKKLLNSAAYDQFQTYVQRLVEPLYKKQKWDPEKLTVIQRLYRTCILAVAARFNLPEASSKVKALFDAWLNSRDTASPVVIEPDLRDIVYYYGMKSASQAEWDKLWEIYLKETDAQELSKMRHALAAPQDVNILKRYLTLAWDETKIRSQDYLTVVEFISSNPSGVALVWDEVRSKWPLLVERFSLNSRYLGSLIPAISSGFNTADRLKEMEDFFAKYPDAGAGELARKQALENVKNNIKWTHNYYQSILSWLEHNNKKAGQSNMTTPAGLKQINMNTSHSTVNQLNNRK